MIIEFPDHYRTTIAAALVAHGAFVIATNGFVPAFVHQYADMWDKLDAAEEWMGDYWSSIVIINKDLKEIVSKR